ncbi:MFS transporter [uncultured bacterium]|nr:MFS transporter [uncultured bacterium]
MESKYSANQKWTVASTALGSSLEGMDVMFISFAMTPIITQLHISGAAGGMMNSVTNIGMPLGALIFGMLADAFGRVRVFTYTLSIVALATGLMYFANNIYFIYLLRFLTGIGTGGEYGTGVTLVMENFNHRKHVATLLSYVQVFGETGAILAAVISSMVLANYSWHVLFLFGLIPIVLAFFVRLNLKENPKFVHNAKALKKTHQKRVPFSRLFATPKIAWQTIAIIMMVVVEAAGYYGVLNWMPSIMQQKLHISITKSSLWMIVTIVGISLGMVVFSKIMDKWGPRWAFTIFLVGAAIFMYTIVMANNGITLLIASTLVGFFAGATYTGFGVIVSKLYPMNIRVTANSFIMSCGKAIGGFSPVVIGYLMDHYSLMAIVVFLSVLYVISLFAMLSIKNLRSKKALNKPAAINKDLVNDINN